MLPVLFPLVFNCLKQLNGIFFAKSFDKNKKVTENETNIYHIKSDCL